MRAGVGGRERGKGESEGEKGESEKEELEGRVRGRKTERGERLRWGVKGEKDRGGK